MNKWHIERLPPGFRYFYSKKAFRDLETQASVSFSGISFGNLAYRDTFKPDQNIQSHFSPVSIDAYQREGEWTFRFHQSGFRTTLLPEEFEEDAKAQVMALLIEFVHQVRAIRDTDFLPHPYRWPQVTLSNNRLAVHFKGEPT